MFISLFFFFLSVGKKTKKKGKTLTLTDFLAVDSGGSNVAPSYPNKSTSWADETDDLDGDGERKIHSYSHQFDHNICLKYHNIHQVITLLLFVLSSSQSQHPGTLRKITSGPRPLTAPSCQRHRGQLVSPIST